MLGMILDTILPGTFLQVDHDPAGSPGPQIIRIAQKLPNHVPNSRALHDFFVAPNS